VTILVTGATGFLGGRLARRLHAGGRPVLATGRAAGPLQALADAGIATRQADLATDELADLAPEAIVHCAGLSDPAGPAAQFEAANVASTRTLLRLAARGSVRRFVYVSTPAVYWRPKDQLGLTETAPLPPPVNHYARTKRRAERLTLAETALSPVVLRPRAIYGKGDTALLPRLAAAAAAGPLPLLRGGQAVTDMTHVDDVAAACIAALDAAPEALPDQPVFNVSGGVPLNLREVIERVCDRTGIAIRWRALPMPVAMGAAGLLTGLSALSGHRKEPRITRYGVGVLAYSQTLDLSRTAAHLGWAPQIGFDQGLAEALDG